MGTDRDWQSWGENSPYYGVLSTSKFGAAKLDGRAESEFFESGEAHVRAVFDAIERREGGVWRPEIAADIGCGVGRLAMPIAGRSGRVFAVDVSPAMLAEVEYNCSRFGVSNLTPLVSDDALSKLPGMLDFVHSYLVLQHIPTRRGMRLIGEMAGRVSDGGYLAFQLYVGCNASVWLRGLVRLRYWLPPVNWLRNFSRGRPLFERPMQLNVYPFGEVVSILRKSGFPVVEAYLDEEAGGDFESVFILAKRSGVAASISNVYS
ncbi:class I SAM-dependent methyltransferase [Stenotrophomonas ginsengisoli]|uniref:class I SAM-dependent methyltransferase n=1 Tax=Stenotrophomonas ginsengisoli TaxID=336566 RepID=UPI0009FA4D58|nr:class I SAM-dependent methyltransferase [Stenotrophomonas ginsengisoli]